MKKKVKLKEAGFDLTGFPSVKAFKEVLKANKLTYKGKIHYPRKKTPAWQDTGRAFVWKGKGIEMHTANNPITGKYVSPKTRAPEKGYASYIGIKGTPAKVEKLAKTILKKTRDIKEYDPNQNSFIW